MTAEDVVLPSQCGWMHTQEELPQVMCGGCRRGGGGGNNSAHDLSSRITRRCWSAAGMRVWTTSALITRSSTWSREISR